MNRTRAKGKSSLRRCARPANAPIRRLSIPRPCRRSNRSLRQATSAHFFAPGVPAELTRAALRRAWVTDPAIRDFIGIAENQWDFTKPDGVPGFGSLELTPELRRMVAQLVGDAPERVPQPNWRTSRSRANCRRTSGIARRCDAAAPMKASAEPQTCSRPRLALQVDNDAATQRKC